MQLVVGIDLVCADLVLELHRMAKKDGRSLAGPLRLEDDVFKRAQMQIIGSAMIPATLSALIGTMEAPIGVLWAWIGVGEVPAVTTLIGGAIVMAVVFGRVLYDLREERLRMKSVGVQAPNA